MFSFVRSALALCIVAAALPAHAALKVLATTSDWGALANEIGGDQVNVYTATSALQDVHRVDAKPSLVARARTADLVVATGAELEIGWLPVLIQESGNSRIQPGSPGYFEAASVLSLVEKPERFDRSLGDIHPQGNPHVQLDPRNIALVAKALSERLSQLDGAHAQYFQQRAKDSIRVGKLRSSVGRARPRRSGASPSSSCIAIKRTCASGSACSRLRRSSRSRACRRPPVISVSS